MSKGEISKDFANKLGFNALLNAYNCYLLVEVPYLCHFTVESSNEIFKGLRLSLSEAIETPNCLSMSSTSSEMVEKLIGQISKASN